MPCAMRDCAHVSLLMLFCMERCYRHGAFVCVHVDGCMTEAFRGSEFKTRLRAGWDLVGWFLKAARSYFKRLTDFSLHHLMSPEDQCSVH